MKTLTLALLLLCGCAHTRKPCNIDRIAQAHPELSACLSNYPSLTIDFMHTIAVLEQEAGDYQ